ncbi:hypothetical protein Tco_1152464 [Tanacetum coccineum]
MRGIVLNKVDEETRFTNEFDQFIVAPRESLFLQPEWLKYFTSVCLAKDITKVSYDELFDYLLKYEKTVIASRAKKLENTHELVAHTSSSQPSPAYYVTHPSSVVDYDDEYQGETFQNDSEDPLTSAMILLARAIT